MASIYNVAWGKLIGAPLIAMVEAEALAAQATRDFITSVGFVSSRENRDGNFGRLRTVTFTYQKQNVNGQAVTEQVTLPLLSLVPIPLLQIKDASLEFNLKITDVEKIERPSAIANAFPAFSTMDQVGMRGYVSGYADSSQEVTANTDMRVKINIAQADMPAGLQKLFLVMENAISSKVPTTVKVAQLSADK